MAALGLMRKALTAQLNVLQAEIEEVRARREASLQDIVRYEGRITKLVSDIDDIRTELQALRDRLDASGVVE